MSHFHTSAGMVEKAFITGRFEGFSDKQIGRMIRECMLSLGYDPSTIRRALPISAKDTTKTRKDYLTRERYNSNELDERKIPSYENRSGFDGNHTSETINELKIKNGELESELEKERNRNEDLTIQCNNAISYITQLRGDLKAVGSAARILSKMISDTEIYNMFSYRQRRQE